MACQVPDRAGLNIAREVCLNTNLAAPQHLHHGGIINRSHRMTDTGGSQFFHSLHNTLRSGRLTGMETNEGMQVIRAQVPLATMLEYNSQLRSITAGEGTFTMTLGHYEAVPPHLQAEIVRNRKAIVEEHLVANH